MTQSDYRIDRLMPEPISLTFQSEGKIYKKTKHDLSFGTCKYKTSRVFLCFVFCSALRLCFDYVLMVILVLMSLYMLSQA